MKASSLQLKDYLGHIHEAITRIERYTGTMDEQAFLLDDLTQDAVLRNFEVIGEASSRIEKYHKNFADAHPELQLTAAYQMRNAIAHGYFQIDFKIVWRTVKTDLPKLREEIVRQGFV